MTYVFEKEMKLAPLKVEYVKSSITNEIKVVDMWYDGKPSKISYPLFVLNKFTSTFSHKSGT